MLGAVPIRRWRCRDKRHATRDVDRRDAVVRISLREAAELLERPVPVALPVAFDRLGPAVAQGDGRIGRRIRAVAASAEQFEQFDHMRRSRRHDEIERPEQERVADLFFDAAAGKELSPVALVKPLDPGCHVHLRAQRGVLHAVRRTDIADDRFAGVKAEARSSSVRSRVR